MYEPESVLHAREGVLRDIHARRVTGEHRKGTDSHAMVSTGGTAHNLSER